MSTQPHAPSSTAWVGLAFVLMLAFGGLEAWRWWHEDRLAKAVKAAAQPGQITVFTTDTCPYCARARLWLTGHDIPWRECNVDRDASCRTTFESQGAPGVPLMHVNGHWQLGFDPQWLSLALKTPPRHAKPSSAGSPRP